MLLRSSNRIFDEADLKNDSHGINVISPYSRQFSLRSFVGRGPTESEVGDLRNRRNKIFTS